MGAMGNTQSLLIFRQGLFFSLTRTDIMEHESDKPVGESSGSVGD